MTVSAPLPALTADEAAHSERVVNRIRDEIDAHAGWITFERYMELALYEPGLGYYSAGSTKLGARGDFVTAPEISPLFSRCLANQCVQVFQNLPGASVLELGAGSGVMAADLLLEGSTGRLVALRMGNYVNVPISVTRQGVKRVDVDALYDVAKYQPKIRHVDGKPMFLY